jgi:hypothetical protein
MARIKGATNKKLALRGQVRKRCFRCKARKYISNLNKGIYGQYSCKEDCSNTFGSAGEQPSARARIPIES